MSNGKMAPDRTKARPAGWSGPCPWRAPNRAGGSKGETERSTNGSRRYRHHLRLRM